MSNTNPAALMQSFFVGQAVRRMRGLEKWETLWEGEATTEAVTSNAIYTQVGDISTEAYFRPGDTIALTVDGVRKTFVAEKDPTYGALVGNKYLYDRDSADTGYDYYVNSYQVVFWQMTFGSRSVGTYSVKIERMQK